MKNLNLRSKGKSMLSVLLLSATLFSCSKETMEDTTLTDVNSSEVLVLATTPSSALVNTNLLFEETFEESGMFTGITVQKAGDYSITKVTSPVARGSYAGKWDLRDTDPLASNGTRAEAAFPIPSEAYPHRWYSFRVFFPAAYAKDSEPELITQWHQQGGSPAVSLEILNDKYQLVVHPTPSTTQKFDLGLIKKDSWNSFVFHINHRNSSDGLIEVWLNGAKVVNRTGDNMHSEADGFEHAPRWKVGIYKWRWNGSETTDTKQRVFYYDDIRMGTSNATYAEMSAGATTTAPAPTPTPTPTPEASGVTFTLVNAATEQDVMSLKDGATISLSALKLSKINVRATPPATFTGSVKFVLSGTQSKTYIDNWAPYAMHGDDRAGNYYYGNGTTWNPMKLGTYTLVATAYQDDNAQGTAGSPTKITFTIVN